MATPAQIANDMAAHAAYWAKRDREIERVCRDAARVIRALMAGEPVDGRTYGGLHMRLLERERRRPDWHPDWHVQGYPDFDRARLCMERLRREAG
ncbi:hypothetical protein [uncultured Roseovarius sp.]|uniref:hypothetical protein n=1 Tax=uncultured Roseovarius sp. TaxID=293344 RepID=UPI0026264A92|nr:hypothetical protein [uncultured Roseovarius sp.]